MPGPALIRIALLFFTCVLFPSAVIGQEANTGAPAVDLSGMAVYERPVDKSYPVTESARISIVNRFGSVSVTAWDNPLTRVVGRIRVGAENYLLAEQFGQSIELVANHAKDRIEIRTEYPENAPAGIGGYTVSLDITVPRGASVTVDNSYGDTRVERIAGAVNVHSRFGGLTLSRIGGPVTVMARGEFPVTAEHLSGGGTFTLRSSIADFRGLAGEYTVNNYLGAVRIQAPGSQTTFDVSAQSADIELRLPADLKPDIEASAAFGAIESEWTLENEAWGQVVFARQSVPESPHRFRLHAAYGDIRVLRDAVQPVVEPLNEDTARQLITQSERERYLVPVGATIALEGIVGDVRVQGTDSNELIIVAKKTARIDDAANAQPVMDGLTLHTEAAAASYAIATMVQGDMAALGCSEYRIDLDIQYPKSSPLRMTLVEGDTVLMSTGPDVVAEQHAGTILAREASGELRLINHDGNITVENAAGPVTATTQGGTVTARRVKGDLRIEADSGRALVESPGGSLRIRTREGDVRVIALDGVRGEYDIAATKGNVSVAVPDTADAFFIVSTRSGAVFSKYELHGSVERDNQTFQGKLNQGMHRVLLEAVEGNVSID